MNAPPLTASIARAAVLSPGREAQLWMLAFVALWAVVEVLAGGVLRSYSPYQVVWTRYSVHLALMLLLWGPRAPRSLVETRRPWYQLARSMLMVGMPASWIIAGQAGVNGRTVLALFWLSPLLVLAFAALLAGERATGRIWIAALIGGAAAVVTSLGPLPSSTLLLVFPAAMACTFALYVVMTRSLRHESRRANLFYTAFGVWVVLLPVMFGVWKTPTPIDAVVMFLVGAIGLVTLYALDRAAARAPVSLSAPVLWMQLAVTAGLVGALGHRPGRLAMVGLVVAIAMAAYVFVREPHLNVVEKDDINE